MSHATPRALVAGLWRRDDTLREPQESVRAMVAGMCRNIRPLFNFQPPATDEECAAAALQYVRKVSGYREPSSRNREAFEAAIDEVAAASARLLDAVTGRPAR